MQTIFKNHFSDFENAYEDKYARTYGQFRLDRISEVVNKFLVCGDYSKGIARVKCQNHDCKHEFFLPFSCKGWYLCPSCHQKRLLLLSEHLTDDILLKLPHSQFVFTIPKSLRIFFRNNKKLFSGISKIIYGIIKDYYNILARKEITTGVIVSYQSYGDKIRANSHWHCIILEGGYDSENNFIYLPIKNTTELVNVFRTKVIDYMQDEKLINSDFAKNLLSWTNSGFSVDNSIKMFKYDDKARVNISQYIARHPASLQNILYVHETGKVIYHTKYNEYWKDNTKVFTALDFIAELTQHIPPKWMHLIRYYGLYSSRTRGKLNEANVQLDDETEVIEQEVGKKASKQAWARLMQKVYEVDPLKCPKCGSEMKIIAVITNPVEVRKIIECLRKNKSPPFDKE